MTTVAALTSGRLIASARFRIRQYVQSLESFGISTREYVPTVGNYTFFPFDRLLGSRMALRVAYAGLKVCKVAARAPAVIGSWRADITWLERDLLHGYLTLEPLLRSPIVLDIDDAIWLHPPFGREALRFVAKRSAAIFAGNSYIASYLDRYNTNIHVIPTTIDTERFTPKPIWEDHDELVIGWTGSSNNFRYLYEIERALASFLNNRRASILVVADRAPKFALIEREKVRFWKWNEESEAEAVRQMDVGISPLVEDEWTLGKCGLKILQYLACGVPVVASPVGVNAEILNSADVGFSANSDDDWFGALDVIGQERDRARALGRNGHALVEQRYSIHSVSPKIAQVFQSLVGSH